MLRPKHFMLLLLVITLVVAGLWSVQVLETSKKSDDRVWLTAPAIVEGREFRFMPGTDMTEYVQGGHVLSYLAPGAYFICEGYEYRERVNVCIITDKTVELYPHFNEGSPAVDVHWLKTQLAPTELKEGGNSRPLQ